jgi:protein-disulfide isomerase
MRSGKLIGPAFLALAMLAGSASAQRSDADLDKLSRAGTARTVGPDSAKVMVLEFLDFECPVCAAFHIQRGDSLKRALGPDVRMVYVNFPLTNHMYSLHSAEAAACAGAVAGPEGFAKVSDALYRQQKDWAESDNPSRAFMRMAQVAGIDTASFADCRSRDLVAPLLLSDIDMAGKFGIRGTPTFVVLAAGARSASEAQVASGNVAMSQLLEMISKARASAK